MKATIFKFFFITKLFKNSDDVCEGVFFNLVNKTKPLSQMTAKVFQTLCKYPSFRRMVWKPIYENLAKHYNFEDWHFMNYGYAALNGETRIPLEAKDENDRYCIQLYHHVATQIDIKGLEVLEVGSGRGGGACYIQRYLKPKKMIGLDIAQNAVNFSNEHHKVDGLKYICGNAEALPFDDNSFDAVINVESCHAYGSVPSFLNEVTRVLRPNGYFLCTDLRLQDSMQLLQKQFEESALTLLATKDIGLNVIKAIELDNHYKNERIQKRIHPWLAPAFAEFAGVKGSLVHKDLISQKRLYLLFLLQNK